MPETPRAASVLIGTRRNRVHTDVPGPQIMGEIANGGFEGGLGDTHDVVVGHDPFRAKIRQRHDGSALRHQRQGRARQRDERIGADIERGGKPLRVVLTNCPVSSSRGAKAME